MCDICPCKGCNDRVVDVETGSNCHSTCEKFIIWSENEKERKEKINSYLKADSEVKSFKKVQVQRAMKRRRS